MALVDERGVQLEYLMNGHYVSKLVNHCSPPLRSIEHHQPSTKQLSIDLFGVVVERSLTGSLAAIETRVSARATCRCNKE